jgi:hypothetical protein
VLEASCGGIHHWKKAHIGVHVLALILRHAFFDFGNNVLDKKANGFQMGLNIALIREVGDFIV